MTNGVIDHTVTGPLLPTMEERVTALEKAFSTLKSEMDANQEMPRCICHNPAIEKEIISENGPSMNDTEQGEKRLLIGIVIASIISSIYLSIV
jgi:hypothetical protein